LAKQMTEMLKGTLEGIILSILKTKPSYGYEIRAGLQENGFTDIAEGTIYALLVRIEQHKLVDVTKVPSQKGPPRKVYSLNPKGEEYLAEFWEVWDFLSSRLDHLRHQTQEHSESTPSSTSPESSEQ
jgi:PadR family transcriptional regulator PadR